jgi:hypothetical protein
MGCDAHTTCTPQPVDRHKVAHLQLLRIPASSGQAQQARRALRGTKGALPQL